MLKPNLIIMGDSYKQSHFLQYPPETQFVYSYIESRGGDYDQTLFFGLQMFLKKYLSEPITQADVDEAAIFCPAHGVPFNKEGWQYVIDRCGGKLPLLIRAAPEGLVIPTGNVLVSIVNTDPNCFWLTSFMETVLLRAVWYPTTVATRSWHIKQIIKKHLELTSDDAAGQLPFKLHDFGARGVSSHESAEIGGAAHLVNFMGSDTAEAVRAANYYYRCDMAGFSIPASEHSTITSWGRADEVEAYRNMLRQFAKPGSLVAIVSDSYNLWEAVDKLWGDTLRREVIDSGATVIIRPDSGDPVATPLRTVALLAEKFGTTTNSKGFKVLNNVRVIQGDGIDEVSITRILEALTAAGYATDNIAFGMGGMLLQGLNRDTLKFAMKCSAAVVGGSLRDVYKDPIGDAGKRSKRGMLALVREDGKYSTVKHDGDLWHDVMNPVYGNGTLMSEMRLSEVRFNSELAIAA